MDRSEKIRTYNYQQDRITDHRTGLTLFGMDSMMSGEYLNKFIEAYQKKIYEEKLEQLL
jgi:peptide chain release factor 1